MSLANGNELEFSLRGEIRYQEPMRRHTSWHTGGYAQRAYIPLDLPDLTCFLRGHLPAEPVAMIGLGSNVLVGDGGLRGTVLLHRALNRTWYFIVSVTTVDRIGRVWERIPDEYEIGYSSAKLSASLIDACGLKGLIIGDTQVTTKHANFIVNLGTATATDIEHLIEKVQLVVKQQQNVELEREISIIGEWN